jgi:molybdate/tungstate transport system substrate-binding protein
VVALATLASPLAAPGSVAGAAAKHSGSVDVLYAGSLLDLMENQIGPAFHRATGYSVVGFSNGSSALASEIQGGTEVGDVFISASPSADMTLQGAANGDWVNTYQEFATSQLVLAYNPASPFAKALRTQPWYDVVTRSGFLLGRTDPATDPKGVLATDALEGVALSYDVPALASLATSNSNIFEETALVGELQAGQLDAGFFYAVEAAAAHLKTVPLTGTDLYGEYTVATLKDAPHPAAAKAFVAFLLGRTGQKILEANGVTPLRTVETFGPSSATTTTTSPTTTTTS